jgi:hypothetical protein
MRLLSLEPMRRRRSPITSSRERRTATCLPILAQPREQSIKDAAYGLHNSSRNGILPIGRRSGQTTRGTDQPGLYRSLSHKFTIDNLDVLQISFTQIQYTTCAPPSHIQQLYASNYLSTLQILSIPRSSSYYGRPRQSPLHESLSTHVLKRLNTTALAILPVNNNSNRAH